MRAVTLLYHDAAEADAPDSSGFPGPGPAVYKLTPAQMTAHFEALAAVGFSPGSVLPLIETDAAGTVARQPAAFITFDDGGISALRIADLLDARGWVGHFFITTDRIGAPTFLSAAGVRELDRRGHVIGSHSATHPPRMSALSPAELRREWGDSVTALADILGRPVVTASVPGGFFSRAVAEAAAAAGTRALFTSEPVGRVGAIRSPRPSGEGWGEGSVPGVCRVLGRYSITRGTPPETAVALARGGGAARARQWAGWNVKKVAKTVGGERYLQLRRYLLRA